MATARTEQQHEDMAPIVVKLGDKTYEIPLLRRGKAAIWRKNLATEIRSIFEGALQKSPEVASEGVSDLFTKAVCELPDRLMEALLSYYPDLPRSVAEEAGDGQIRIAFS